MKLFMLVLFFGGTALFASAAEKNDLKKFFSVQTFQEAPPNIEILSESSQDEIKTTALKFDGGLINGKPTRIFAYYSRPEAQGVYPGVLVIHGAGLGVLNPDAIYCKQGFATLVIDWAGKAPGRKEPRKPPFSEFESNGCMADTLSGKWKLSGVENDGIRIGVVFARRGMEFLRNQPEVDKSNLYTVGSSAGAHLSLILLGVEPGIKASVVKYGTGFIRDIPGSFGGYFGPISLCSKEDQDNWLAFYDPKESIQNYRAKVLLISGTDDIFFWMRNVLMTYSAIPTEKRLLIRPNDNHNWVGADPVSANFFLDAYRNKTLEWPDAPAPLIQESNGKLNFIIKPSTATPLKDVSLVWKSSPRGFFGHAKNWQVLKAVKQDEVWVASMDAPSENQQIVAYALLTDNHDRMASSDTVESPRFPLWRGKTEPAQTLDDGNALVNPSFDWQLQPQSLGWLLLGGPMPELVSGDEFAHSGKNAILLKKGNSCLRKEIRGLQKGEYTLSFWSKSLSPVAGLITLRTIISANGKNDSRDQHTNQNTSYQRHDIVVSVPEGCGGFIFELWGCSSTDQVVDDFSLLPAGK
jgi:dienelactone hydrolase